MILTNVLIDLNVCLDVIFKSRSFAAPAQEIAERSESGDFKATVAAHGFDTMFFVLRKRIGKTKANRGIKAVRRAFGVAPVTEPVIDEAIKAAWNDFEDSIHYQAALAAGCDAIVTRNKKDFKQAELPLLSPREFLGQLQTDEEG